MVDACKLLGVDVMTGALGIHARRRARAGNRRRTISRASIEFLAQNVKTADFGDPVFKPYVMREMNGVPVAIIGQAFPYTPIANPRYFVADWTFGIQEENAAEARSTRRAPRARRSWCCCRTTAWTST